MNSRNFCTIASCLAAILLAPTAFASSVPIGYISLDTTGANIAAFDIVNETGGNSSVFPDTTFPVTTSVSLSNLNLDIKYSSAPDLVFGPASGYFVLSLDGISFDGTPLSETVDQNSNGIFGAVSATLTGNLSTTHLTLNDGSSVNINPHFSVKLTDGSGFLVPDNDVAVIYGSSGPNIIPEPETFTLVGAGLLALVNLRRRNVLATAGKLIRREAGAGLAWVLFAVLLAWPIASTAATTPGLYLSAFTSPSASTVGNPVNVSGNGFPPGAINPANVVLDFGPACMGSIDATATPTLYKVIIGTSGRLQFIVPTSLATGAYYIWLHGTSAAGKPYSSLNCSQISVTNTSTTLAACLPSSSMAVLSGKNVVAYVPRAAWYYGAQNVSVVNIEGTAIVPTEIPTSGYVNSCSSNSTTGETVCVDNFNGVYEITGTTLNRTLTASANYYTEFSGGYCDTCGVAIDALTNSAVISGGYTGSYSNTGVQVLNLANNTFSAPTALAYDVSEDVSIDPNRNLILSPGEGGNYDLIKVNSTGSLTEYANPAPNGVYATFDSAAEDCTTGIALATEEYQWSGYLYLTDLTQATFTPPAPGYSYGTWSAPGQNISLFPDGDFQLEYGTNGISVAPGTTHLGITEGEFGGNSFVAFQLPATSGTGTPSLVDWVGAYMPNTPDGSQFSAGFDPHTITAYTSPNNGKAYGVLAGWYYYSYPKWLGIVDLQALLSAPRSGSDPHLVDPSVNLLTSGIVRYIAVP
jgi:hypothetical protein